MENIRKETDLELKQTLLVVDDDEINGDIIASYFEDEFEIMRAFNGQEALDILNDQGQTIDLVLLDIFMPKLNGFEVLKQRQNSQKLKKIPFIVMTSEKETEEECFHLGVNDFIRKPYENPDIIVARVKRMIELYQDRSIIKEVKRDKLTRLYSLEFFKLYSDQFNNKNPDMVKDLLAVNVSRFRLINERYGKPFGDAILVRMAAYLKLFVREKGGLAGRISGDEFLLYCPHQENYDEFLNKLAEAVGNDFHLKVGIYQCVENNIDFDILIGRAVGAMRSIDNKHNKTVAYFNSEVQNTLLMQEDLISSFENGIKNKEFKIYYQPKYSIQGNRNRLASCEALVRWINPKHGFISPGVFIPLFESNGMIQKLDRYVFEEAARQQAEWYEKYKRYIPISVNVSRIDLFSSSLVDEIVKTVDKYHLPHEHYYLEITESAYTENNGDIIKLAESLKDNGFVIEIDDFGSGYSGLNVLAELTFDVLKIDMAFIRKLDENEKNKKLVKLIINIAQSFGVKTVAEGCEKESHYRFLKDNGCDIIQGYYFSKPLPSNEFEALIDEELSYDD